MQVQKESQSSSRAQSSEKRRKKRRRRKKRKNVDLSLFIITEKKESLYIPLIPELYINEAGDNQQDAFMLYIIKVCAESKMFHPFVLTDIRVSSRRQPQSVAQLVNTSSLSDARHT